MKNGLVWILLIGSVAVVAFILTGRGGDSTTVTLDAREPASGASASPATGADGGQPPPQERTFEIVTLLPKDAIPAVYQPQLISAAEADSQYRETDPVIGVEIDGDARAYNIPFLSRREIVNDTVGGRKIAVTW